MVEESAESRAYTRMEGIAASARTGKAELVNATELHTFNLTGLTDIEPYHGRLRFPGKADQFSYNPEKLMAGIIAGDFTATDAEEVKVYYPHERGGQLIGKTVFRMRLTDAAALLRRCAAEMQLPEQVLKPGVDGYSTGISYFGDQDNWKLHEHDIAMAFSLKLSK
jgi:hypothetical protein